jgi:alginate production protein
MEMKDRTVACFPRWVFSWTLRCSLLASLLIVSAAEVTAKGGPEYMKLNYVPGISLEIKGVWNDSGALVATDIEQLPKPRTPKVRGKIQRIDSAKRSIVVLGRTILITKSTRFLEADSSVGSFESLKVGQQIEVSCTVRDDGENKAVWKARKIKTNQVKSSSKVKGVITRVAVDGASPDTLEIHGLIIILNTKTDINWPRGELEKLEYDRFKYAALQQAQSSKDGIVLANGLLFTAKYRGEVENEAEHDLSPTFAADKSDVQPGIRAELTAFASENVKALAQVRWRKKYAISTDSNATVSGAGEVDITQLYLLLSEIGNTPVTLQVGRQDIDEPREWLFDDYLDAIRIHYITTSGFTAQAAVILSVSPIKSKFDPWTDYYAEAGWRFDRHSAANVYVLARKDTSLRNREPVWWGVRYFGRPTSSLRSWFDAALMRGTDKGRSQSAWALDFGATYMLAPIGGVKPNLTLGYAVGSGDEVSGDLESQEFRQTGYQDNVARMGGVAQIRYYGEALNPELSNMKIFTAGVGAILKQGASVEALYHTYRQHRPDSDLTKSALVDPPARPNGGSADLGWGIDVIATSPEFWERFQLRYTLSVFDPGAAFEPFNETAILNRLNVDVTL